MLKYTYTHIHTLTNSHIQTPTNTHAYIHTLIEIHLLNTHNHVLAKVSKELTMYEK